jgi:hypothetical protein
LVKGLALGKECSFAAFLDLSAKTLTQHETATQADFRCTRLGQMAKTSQPELFQHIRDDAEARRKKQQIVLALDALKKAIKKAAPKLYEEATRQCLSRQGRMVAESFPRRSPVSPFSALGSNDEDNHHDVCGLPRTGNSANVRPTAQ